MKALLMGFLLLTATASFAGDYVSTDESGEKCTDKVARITKEYFQIVDTSESVKFYVSKDDQMTALTFKSTSPGSYDQTYESVVKIALDRSANNYRPKKDQKIKLKLTGDYDCDNLKIKSVESLGGVERND